jgi:DNA-binding GntR family transcriptional regulator
MGGEKENPSLQQKTTAAPPETIPSGENGQTPYSILRKDIVELRLKPGTIVSIRDLCAHFHISRSPMRDALIRLEEEGLVGLLPQRGIMISRIDIRRVEEERFLRISVERNVMRLFMKQHAPEDMVFLEASIVKQKRLMQTRDYRSMIALDDEFHRYFYKVTGKMFCADAIWKASGHYSRLRLLTCVSQDISQEVTNQHSELVEAVNAGDTDRMLAVFDCHLGRLDEEVKGFSAKYPDLFLQKKPADRENDLLKNDFLKTLKG